MGKLKKISSLLAKIAAYLSAIILVYMILHILLEITLRVLFFQVHIRFGRVRRLFDSLDHISLPVLLLAR